MTSRKRSTAPTMGSFSVGMGSSSNATTSLCQWPSCTSFRARRPPPAPPLHGGRGQRGALRKLGRRQPSSGGGGGGGRVELRGRRVSLQIPRFSVVPGLSIHSDAGTPCVCSRGLARPWASAGDSVARLLPRLCAPAVSVRQPTTYCPLRRDAALRTRWVSVRRCYGRAAACVRTDPAGQPRPAHRWRCLAQAVRCSGLLDTGSARGRGVCRALSIPAARTTVSCVSRRRLQLTPQSTVGTRTRLSATAAVNQPRRTGGSRRGGAPPTTRADESRRHPHLQSRGVWKRCDTARVIQSGVALPSPSAGSRRALGRGEECDRLSSLFRAAGALSARHPRQAPPRHRPSRKRPRFELVARVGASTRESWRRSEPFDDDAIRRGGLAATAAELCCTLLEETPGMSSC